MTNVVLNNSGLNVFNRALSFGKRGRAFGSSAAGGFDGNPANLANRLLWLDGSDTTQAAGDPATGITSYTSKDPVGYVFDVISGTVTMTGGAFNLPGSNRIQADWSDGDPLSDAFRRNLVGTLLLRAQGASFNRAALDMGPGGGTSADGVQIAANRLFANGTAGYFPLWTDIGGGTLPQLDSAATTYDVMVVLNGSDVTAYVNDAVETDVGVLIPVGAGSIGGARTNFSFGSQVFGANAWDGDIFQLVATSDLLTADDFAAFRAWSP